MNALQTLWMKAKKRPDQLRRRKRTASWAWVCVASVMLLLTWQGAGTIVTREGPSGKRKAHPQDHSRFHLGPDARDGSAAVRALPFSQVVREYIVPGAADEE